MLSNKGIDFLVAAKDAKIKLLDFDKEIKNKESIVKSKRDKQISLQSSQKHEVNKTISERRRNIEDVYEKNIDVIQKDIKEEETRRSKSKSAQVAARIAEANKDLVNDNKGLEENLNALSKKHKVSLKSNSKAYFTFLVPRGMNECATGAGVIFSITAIILLLIHFFGPNNLKPLFYVIFALGYAVIYMLKANYISKNMSYLKESRGIYDKMASNDRLMEINANKIKNDKREDIYDLAEFDERLKELRNKLENQLDEKSEKLSEFDEVISAKIEEDIYNKYEDQIDKAISECKQSEEELDGLKQEKERHANYTVATFDNELGDDFKELRKIEELLKIMNENVTVTSVEDAIEVYYQE